jgi:DNA (cytosine-5)-methyltransferase 1
MENVNGAPLLNPIMLCGTQFGLKVYRHRFFESNWFCLSPPHFSHNDPGGMKGQNNIVSPKGFVCIAGNHAHTKYAPTAMGIDWMNQKELSQAIPPAYTEWIGKRLMKALGAR